MSTTRFCAPLCALVLVSFGCSSKTDPAPLAVPDAAPPSVTVAAFGPKEPIDGKSYAQISEAWWKWALATPKGKSPVTGKDCKEGQSGNVWFLAGTADGEPATRTCEVPEGKILFFPLVNAICYPCHEEEGCETPKTEAELKSCAELPALKELSASIDGTALAGLEGHKFTSAKFGFKGATTDPLFMCSGPIGSNTCGIPEGDRFGISEGYWLAIKPLSKGVHTLKFRAVIPGVAPEPDFVQDVTYTITIK